MKRLIPFIVLILVFIGGIVAIPFLLSPERHRQEITTLLSSVFKKPVVVGPMSMSYFPPILQLRQVAVMKEGSSPLLEIDSVTAPVDMGGLFQLKFVPTALQLSHWKMQISRRANGQWDLPDWFGRLPAGHGASGAYPVSWTDGEMRWQDSFTNPPQEIALGALAGDWDPAKSVLHLRGDFTGLGSPAHMTLAGNPQGGDIQITDAGNTCVIHLDNKSEAWDARGASAKWPVDHALVFLKFYGRASAKSVDAAKGLELHNWQFHLLASSSAVTLEHSAEISGGLSEVKGTISSSSGILTAHLQAAAKDIPVQVFLAMIGEGPILNGQTTLIANDIQVELSSGTAIVRAGQGYGELKGGRYVVPSSSLARLAKAKTMPYMKKKFSDLDVNGIPVTRLSAHWQIKEGILSTEDGRLISTDIKAGWVGHVDQLRRGIDATARLEIHEHNAALRSLIPSRYQAGPAFGRLQGSWQEWSLRSVPSGRIPAGIQSKLRKAINQK